MASYYVVQSFTSGKSGTFPDTPIQAQSVDQARRLAQRLAAKKEMVIAFMRDGNPKTGDYGDPKLIFAYGKELPEELADMEKV
ncbi:MAG: hypothetical protein BGO05_10080 [Rhizobiales bacterium 63-7]|nr:hypothetical protein [Hyphomicrobiales bacterium]OJU66188.1 MAG: hypothetical protein BGO05_10080 [Rhizobiales bacterium 63-7]